MKNIKYKTLINDLNIELIKLNTWLIADQLSLSIAKTHNIKL